MSPPWVTWSGQALVAPLGAEAPEAQPVAPPAVPADALAPTADGFAAPARHMGNKSAKSALYYPNKNCICPQKLPPSVPSPSVAAPSAADL